jgi:hypothetical protein
MGKKLAIMTLVVLLVGLIGPAAIGQSDPSLMGWWKFDGDALDSSGNNRTGTLVGTPRTGRPVWPDADLDGTGDYVNITWLQGRSWAQPFQCSCGSTRPVVAAQWSTGAHR